MTASDPSAVAPTPQRLAEGSGSVQGSAGHARAGSGHRHLARVHHHGNFHRLVTHAAAARASPATAIPDDVTKALRAAMDREGVPDSWESGLRFLVGHESGGQVGVANTHDSARGLFQLTRASYGLNPNGAASFGNAVEEAQGGIRYIVQRYRTADNAVQFWRRHRFY